MDETRGRGQRKLGEIYYDLRHPAGYGSARSLKRASGRTMRETKEWLSSQPAYTLHKAARRSGYDTRQTMTRGIDYQWQADLVVMDNLANHNDGYKYMLTVVDCFSRYAWARPIKNKGGRETARALRSIFDSEGRAPLKLHTDKGREFRNREVQKLLSEYDVHFFTTESVYKAALVERFNRTLKSKCYKVFTHRNTLRWIDFLDDLVTGYNATKHRVIGMAPRDVNTRNEMFLWRKLYGRERKKWGKKHKKNHPPKLQVGDLVRLSKVKGHFEKSYFPNWTEEIFSISKVSDDTIKGSSVHDWPPAYRITDHNGEPVRGIFYREELQKVIKTDDVYRVEKVLKTKGQGKHKRFFVKWLGYPMQFASWISSEDFVPAIATTTTTT